MQGPTAHLSQTPKLPNELEPTVPFDVAVIVLRAMALDARARAPTMGAVVEALRTGPREGPSAGRAVETVSRAEVRGAVPPPPRRRLLPIVALFVFALGAGGLGAALHAIASAAARHPEADAGAAVAFTSASREVPEAAPPPPVQPSSEPRAPALASRPLPVAPAPRASGGAGPSGGQCQCRADAADHSYQVLCAKGADVRQRVCTCRWSQEAASLSSASMLCHAPCRSLSDYDFQGRNLVEGAACSGLLGEGRTAAQGQLFGCIMSCTVKAFSGVHRTPCRGLRRTDGVEVDGTLDCF